MVVEPTISDTNQSLIDEGYDFDQSSMMSEKVSEVLANLKDYHPAYDASAGYELAGFVWFQGFNDQFSDPFRDNYKQNMITFIKDTVRRWISL